MDAQRSTRYVARLFARDRQARRRGMNASKFAAVGPRVVWCSPSFGYNGDLMYFKPILEAFVALFPRTSIPVERGFPIEKYPNLPLRPILRFRRRSSRTGSALFG